MNTRQIHDPFGEYRGQLFLIETRQHGDVWTGHYRLVGRSEEIAAEAESDALHVWVPLDPGWATENEAQTNAIEAAHAAIDALTGGETRRQGGAGLGSPQAGAI